MPYDPQPRGRFDKRNYIYYRSRQLGLDPVAVIAVANAEGGFSGAIGDHGTSFGPFQLHMGGALPSWVSARGARFAQQWANSQAGIDYALKQIQRVAKGLKGQAAVNAIVLKFERPANPSHDLAALGASGAWIPESGAAAGAIPVGPHKVAPTALPAPIKDVNIGGDIVAAPQRQTFLPFSPEGFAQTWQEISALPGVSPATLAYARNAQVAAGTT